MLFGSCKASLMEMGAEELMLFIRPLSPCLSSASSTPSIASLVRGISRKCHFLLRLQEEQWAARILAYRAFKAIISPP